MSMRFNISIKRRIYLSFGLMVLFFALSGLVILLTLHKNQKKSKRLTQVINPSLKTMGDYEKMLMESEMYITNWVMLQNEESARIKLNQIHDVQYPQIKEKLEEYSSKWKFRNWADSLHSTFRRFEEVIEVEKSIMQSFNSEAASSNPSIRLKAESLLEEVVHPRTGAILASLNSNTEHGLNMQVLEQHNLEIASSRLKRFLFIIALAVIITAIILSLYLANVIIGPVEKINQIIDALGKGITRKVANNGLDNEIGRMINSVNTLSEKLETTACFAREVGARNFDMPYVPLSGDDTLGKSLIAMRDNLRTNEANLEQQRKELERKNRELEQFAFVASHDLQEPLRTTSSFVELFHKQYINKIDENADRYLDYILQSSNRMKTLITDLLEYSRIGSDKEIVDVDCELLVNEALSDFSSTIFETGAQISRTKLPVVKGHATELRQVFHNLIFNALKFRKKGHTPFIKIACEQKNGNWQFLVSDNGIGIAEEHYDRIFIIFQRLHTRTDYPGSGIGLSHCKKIVELHKGKIWLESELDAGTNFYFTLPYKN